MSAGVRLEQLTWVQAETWFARDPLVVIPLGAAAKEHGPHLPLNNDAVIAEWLAEETCRQLPVVVAPLVNTSFYPAFVDYPGSISLQIETARDVLIDICRSLARHGPSRFYVINTGLSTLQPLAQARQTLSGELDLRYLNLDDALAKLPPDLLQQEYGSHADEHETSLMLHIAPEVVDMSLAVDDGGEGEGRLSRERGQGTWSVSGVFGRATLASADKGKVIADVLRAHVVAELQRMLSDRD